MATNPPPPPPESLMDTLFSYDNTIMLAAIISLLLVILFVLLLHLYARWFLSHHHHRRQALRAQHRHRASTATVTTYDLSPAPNKDGACTGLDAAAINSIPTFSHSSSAAVDCAVCLSEFEEGEVGRSLPRCSHCFHVECIDTWLRAHTTCPVCRLDVVVQFCKEGFSKEDKEDDVVLDIRGVDDDNPTSTESANFERLMRMAVSRSCRSDFVSTTVANHRSERPRPSV
ncbi:hypothetical protein V2J09_009989 [Rumex salicifolius]